MNLGRVLRTSRETSQRMSHIRQSDTSIEKIVRHLVSDTGARYRLANRDLPGSPDLANRAHGWAIFVNGCFWHGHRNCRAATLPKTNVRFWREKIAANRKRDVTKSRQLRKLGFRVMTVWGCEISRRGVPTRRLVSRLSRFLGAKPSWGNYARRKSQ